MGFIEKLKGALLDMLLREQAKKQYSVVPLSSETMDRAQATWLKIYNGNPNWLSSDVKSHNFAKILCMVTANLVTLDIGIKIDGSKRAEYLQNQLEKSLMTDAKLRKWVEYACAGGMVIFKPNGTGVDLVLPGNFVIVGKDDNGQITKIIFKDTESPDEKTHYTRLEYHENLGDRYVIRNKVYFSKNKGEIGNQISLEVSPWVGLEPEITITKEEGFEGHMLFGVFTMPGANNIDLTSMTGMALFSEATEELEALDVALSETFYEIKEARDIELLAAEMLERPGIDGKKERVKTPRHMIPVFTNFDKSDYYQRIERPLKTDQREVGINLILNLIATKCGYSEGYFSYNSKTGIATATQVESDDRKTIQLIKDIRDALKTAIDQTVYALDIFADIYELAPAGEYEITYNFGDITYSYDEDRARWYTMATSGMVPKWMYLVKFEGYTEEEAKAIVAEAQGGGLPGFFDKEE